MNTLATSSALTTERIPSFRLRLPMILLFVLLLPLAPLLLLVLLVVCSVYGVNPFRAAAALFRLLAGLKGTQIEVQNSQVLFVINLF
jgi:hypothetical protein